MSQDLGTLEIATLEPKFPSPLLPPLEVPEARHNRYRSLMRSAKRGIAVRLFLAGIEFVAALAFGSASLFMDALATSLDIGTSLVLLVSFRLAARPPDENHPFGHGRYEPLAGLQLGLFLVVLGIGMFFYNSNELHQVSAATLPKWLWLVPFLATLLLEGCYQLLIRTAKKQNSPALAADAVHYRIDSISSIFATAALFSTIYAPGWSHFFDHLGAILIAIFMVIVGIIAARNNMHQLLDHIPSESYFAKVKQAALRTEGVRGTEKIRMQLFGPDAHVGIDIEVDPTLTVEVAHAISQSVRVEIQKEIPEVRDVIVHIEPYYPNDHL